MMKGKKFLPVLVLVCLVALGAMGVAYAAWSQNLYVNGTATTGTFGVKWSSLAAADLIDPLGVGSCAASLVTAVKTDDDVRVAITNAYPGYGCQVTAKVYNYGTVPAKWDGVTPVVTGTIPSWLDYSASSFSSAAIAPSTESSGLVMDLRLTAGTSTPEGESIALGTWAAINFITAP